MAEVPGRNRTLQGTVEQIPDVPVPKTVSRGEAQQWTKEHISDIPVPQVVEGLVEVIKLQVVEKTDEKTVEAPQAQFVDKAAGTPVAVQRQVPVIQTVNEEEVHESADDGGPNVSGRGNFADVELFKQMQETCNPKSEHLSPNVEKQSIPARIPGKPDVETMGNLSRPSQESTPSLAGVGKASMIQDRGKDQTCRHLGTGLGSRERSQRKHATWEGLGLEKDKRRKED